MSFNHLTQEELDGQDFATYVNAILKKMSENDGGTLVIPSGTWALTKQICVPGNVSLRGSGRQNTTLQCNEYIEGNFSNGALVYIQGGQLIEIDSCIALDIKRYQTSFTLRDGCEIPQPGTVLLLCDMTPKSYNGVDDTFHAGEYVAVVHTIGRRIFVSGAFKATRRDGELRYSAASTAVYKMTGPRGTTVSDLRIVGPDTTTTEISCLMFSEGRNVVAHDLTLEQGSYALCVFNRCFGAVAERVDGEAIFDPSARNGNNYGIVVGASQDVSITNCRLTALRHAVTLGGSRQAATLPSAINRDVLIRGCTLRTIGADPDKVVNALDCHGNSEDYAFSDNIVYGGIIIAGAFGKITNNRIFGLSGQAEVGIYGFHLKGTEHEITGNTIHTFAGGSLFKRGAIYLAASEETDIGGPTLIQNNRILVANDPDLPGGPNHEDRGICARYVLNKCDGTPKTKLRWSLQVRGNDVWTQTPGRLLYVQRFPGDSVTSQANAFRHGGAHAIDVDIGHIPFHSWGDLIV